MKTNERFNPAKFLASVTSGRTLSTYHKGDIIFEQGSAAGAVFYIKSGKIKVRVISLQGKEAVVAMLGADEFMREGCLFHDRVEQTIVVQGPNCEIPTTLAIPIGLIVNELITNSAKHAHSNITVRFETLPPVSHSITVLDDGPGLPGGFDPADSKGLGMRIVLALVKEIGKELRFQTGENGHGTRVTVTFNCGSPETASSH